MEASMNARSVVPLDELIGEGELPVQEHLDVHHLLSERVLTLQEVAGDLGLVLELDARLQAFSVLRRPGEKHTEKDRSQSPVKKKGTPRGKKKEHESRFVFSFRETDTHRLQGGPGQRQLVFAVHTVSLHPVGDLLQHLKPEEKKHTNTKKSEG